MLSNDCWSTQAISANWVAQAFLPDDYLSNRYWSANRVIQEVKAVDYSGSEVLVMSVVEEEAPPMTCWRTPIFVMKKGAQEVHGVDYADTGTSSANEAMTEAN
ncbi:hypothetical protein N643_04595 [Salmonella bongori serovar 48:z41:-- str. RKS3044]|nr:hypothetical protein N643_04595 [Salmonella bongori serovar 48:z41:-- str. RKS3044]